MKLTSFRQQIPKAILARGAGYQKNGHVLEVSEESDGVWRAEVQGTEIFVVRIETVGRGEIECMCTCPNDEDDVCEHVAAVLLTLETMMMEGEIGRGKKRKAPAKKKETRPEKLRRLLGRLPPEALLELVLRLAEEDTALLNRLILLVDDGKATEADYRRVIKEAMRAGRGSNGYVNTTGAKRVAAIVSGILDQADEAQRSGLTSQALLIVRTVNDELNAAIGQVDDKNGHLEEPYLRVTALLGRIAKALTGSDRNALLAYLVNRSDSAEALQGGNGWDMLGIAVEMVNNGQERELLDSLLARLEKQWSRYPSWGDSKSSYERCVELRMALIQRFDSAKALREFMVGHCKAHSVRMKLITLYIEENEPRRALQLAEEGAVESRKEGYIAKTIEYRKLQASLLESMGDSRGLIDLTMAIWVETRRQEDFTRLKELVPPAEWPAIRKKLAAILKRDTAGAAWLWSREGEWDEVLKIVRTDARIFFMYHGELEKHFPAEVAAICEKAIARILAGSNTYFDGEITIYLQSLKQMGMQERVAELIAMIKQRYPRRPMLLRALTMV